MGCLRPKMLFESEEKARNFIKFNAGEISERSRHVPVRGYYCQFCGGWHVTSADESNASDKEKQDAQLWESMRLERQGSVAQAKNTDDRSLKYMVEVIGWKRRKSVPTAEQLELRRLGQRLGDLHGQVMSAMKSVEYARAEALINESRETCSKLKQRVDEYGDGQQMYDKAFRNMQDDMDLLNVIKGLINDKDARRKYLDSLSGRVQNKFIKRIVHNLSAMELIDEQCGLATALIQNGEYDAAKEIVRNIRVYKSGIRGAKVASKKADRKLLDVMELFPKESKHERQNQFIAVIEHLEQAHAAYRMDDYLVCVEHVEEAKRLMPKKADDATASFLWAKIASLDSLFNDDGIIG